MSGRVRSLGSRMMACGAATAASFVVWPAVSSAAPVPSRIVYSSDWAGPMQLYAVDPSGREPLAQVTFDRVTDCAVVPLPCGFIDPLPSPDGRWLAYCEHGGHSTVRPAGFLWVASADGRNARRLGEMACGFSPLGAVREGSAAWSPDSRAISFESKGRVVTVRVGSRPTRSRPWWKGPPKLYRAVSPDGRWVAEASGRRGLVVTARRGGGQRQLVHDPVYSIAWAPDSRSIAYVEGHVDWLRSATGSLRVVTLAGVDRVIVGAGDLYGGQISTVAWVRPPRSAQYRPPEAVDGVFAGGPIARLAADRDRVALVACRHGYVWMLPSGDPARVNEPPAYGCPPPADRSEIYDVAIAGDRVMWAEKAGGLSFQWWIQHATMPGTGGRPGSSYRAASGWGALGSNLDGGGALVGGGGLLAYTVWNSQRQSGGSLPWLMKGTLYRANEHGCPCPAIGYGAVDWGYGADVLAPPLAMDTDGARILALRFGDVVLLDGDGHDLVTIPVRASAAQLDGDTVVLLVPGELRVHDATTGALRRRFPLGAPTTGRDCRAHSEPNCPYGSLRLQDAARGLAAYDFAGRIHVLDLSSGRDIVAGYGSEARFTDRGLVRADGARLRITPYEELGP